MVVPSRAFKSTPDMSNENVPLVVELSIVKEFT
jgi:hypothetical protein